MAEKARVIKSTGSWYTCINEAGETINARIVGKFRLKGMKTTNPIAVGDYVICQKEAGLETATITEILDRENYIIRKSPRNPNKNHIIAANLDQLFVIATVRQPRTSLGFIDRMLIVSEMHHIPAVILFNKKDIYRQKDLDKFEEYQSVYQTAGYEAVMLSAFKEQDIAVVQERMKEKTTLFAGHSGVGKSTLINHLLPGMEIETKEISTNTNKGQHTTTFAQMHPLPNGGYIVDTPGIKELETIDLEIEEVSHYYPEMRAVLNDCKYNNCLHKNEPKCAVKAGMEDGSITAERYQSYLRILEGVEATNYWER